MNRIKVSRIKQVVARTERGASAVVVAFSLVFVFAAGALGMDIAKLAYSRQQVRTAIDAAAEAGAYALPNTTKALSDAKSFASANFSQVALADSNVKFYCTVKRLSSGGADTSQLGYMCDPGTAGVDYQTSDIKCNSNVCAIPCKAGKTCNTITVTYNMTVEFNFAPAIGIDSGQTGAQTSASCRGACGEVAPNPMDVVVMADRTPSMKDGSAPSGSFTAMKQGLRDMLLTMNREQQFVAFGTIAISVPTSGCRTNQPTGNAEAFTDATYKVGKSWSSNNKLYHFAGSWVPVSYSWNYTTGSSAAGNLAVNSSDPLPTAINCMDYSDDTVKYPNSSNGSATYNNEGTHLASALKGATRFILDDSKRAGFPDRSAFGVPKKVIIFETDGAPSEIFNSSSTANSINNDWDIGSAGNGNSTSCNNLRTIADQAKAQGITIITIGVGSVNSAYCGGDNVYDVLADVASPKNGVAATGSDCSNATVKAKENSDGDNYFCGATAQDLRSVFAAAMGSVTGNTKFIKIPGVGD